MNRPLFLLLSLLISQPVLAQSKYWRLGVAYQTGPSISYFRQDVSFPYQRISFTVLPARAILLTAERDLNPWLRVNLSVRRMIQDFRFRTQARYIIPGIADEQYGIITTLYPDEMPFGGVGLTANTRSYGPFTFMAGVDLLARYSSLAGESSLIRDGSQIRFLRPGVSFTDIDEAKRLGYVAGVDYVQVSWDVTYREPAVPALTMAVSPRAGVEMQLLDRFSLYVGAVSTLGLGPIVRGQGDIDLTGQRVRTEYGHNGGFWGIQVGGKVHLWRKKSQKNCTFNQPLNFLPSIYARN